MKKTTNFLFIIGVVVLFASSCEKDKDGKTVTKTIPVEINANETYTYEVPHDVMQFTKQASHYKISKITPASNGKTVFVYTPALNYVGTDEVMISSTTSNGNGGNCGNGNHHGDDDDDEDRTTYHFKIIIKGTVTNSRD